MMTITGSMLEPCGLPDPPVRRGFTLIELLIAMLISGIAFFGLVVPFVGERSFWMSGSRQTEAQRDAQIGLRAMARVARESSLYTVNGAGDITFTTGCGTHRFQGGPTFGSQLRLIDGCAGGATRVLIDGGRSQVTTFTVTAVNSRLVRIQLVVTHQNQGVEQMETELFLRNAT